MNIYYENRTADFHFRESREDSLPLDCAAHLHYHIEIAVIYRGRVSALIDNVRYSAKEGDIVISFPNQVHFFENSDGLDYALYIVNPDMVPELAPIFSSKLPASNLISSSSELSELFYITNKISSVFVDGELPHKNTVLKGYLTSFLALLAGKMEFKEISSKDQRVFGSILNYCINHSAEDLSLSVLERDLHISKYYISRVISEGLQMGFNDYVNSLRVSDACSYLAKSDMSVTEISGIVGFNTLRTFNRAFRKQMGISPGDYRKNIRAGNMPIPTKMAHETEEDRPLNDTN